VGKVQLPVRINSFRFTPDSKLLAVGSETGQLDFWKTDGTLAQSIVPEPQPAVGVYFTSDKQNLVSVTASGQLQYWGMARFDKQKRGQLALTPADVPLKLSPDGKCLATVTKEGTLRLWQTVDGELLWTGNVPLAQRKSLPPPPVLEPPKVPPPVPKD